jgi:transcription antitermination factor NusG
MISQDLGQSGGVVRPWFALRVRSKHEQVASLHLRSRGYEEFSPFYKVERQWSDRKKTGEQSLFPGYVFCRLDGNDRLPVLTVPGVVGIVGFGDGPAAIPEEEVGRVRTMMSSGLVVMPWPFLKVGETVLIEHGPLAGVEGILREVKGKWRIVVSINLLQRSVSSEIDRAWVRPVKPPASSEKRSASPRPESDRHVLDSALLK